MLDVLEDALVVANPEWDDCGFAVCRRITNEYLDYTGSDDDFVLDYAEEYLEYDFQQLYGGQWPDTSWEVVDESNASNRIATMRGYIWNDEMDAYMWTVIYWDTSYNNAMAKTCFGPEYNGYDKGDKPLRLRLHCRCRAGRPGRHPASKLHGGLHHRDACDRSSGLFDPADPCHAKFSDPRTAGGWFYGRTAQGLWPAAGAQAVAHER